MTYLERNNKRRVCTQFVNDHCAIRRGAHLANVLSNLHINSKGRHGRVYAAEGNNATYSCERTLCEIFWWGRCRPVSFVSIKSVVRWVGQLGSKMQKSKKFKKTLRFNESRMWTKTLHSSSVPTNNPTPETSNGHLVMSQSTGEDFGDGSKPWYLLFTPK